MIDTKQLRIDNIVYVNRGILRPHSVCIGDFAQGADRFDDFEPIPLTGEILLKCGFKQVPFYENVYELGDIRMHTDVKGKTREALFLLYNSSQELAFEKEISSLHQLQNLHYSILGKELEVKL